MLTEVHSHARPAILAELLPAGRRRAMREDRPGEWLEPARSASGCRPASPARRAAPGRRHAAIRLSGRRQALCSNRKRAQTLVPYCTGGAVTSRGDDAQSLCRRQHGRIDPAGVALELEGRIDGGETLAVRHIGLPATGTDARILRRVAPFRLLPEPGPLGVAVAGRAALLAALAPRARLLLPLALAAEQRLRQDGPSSGAWQAGLPVFDAGGSRPSTPAPRYESGVALAQRFERPHGCRPKPRSYSGRAWARPVHGESCRASLSANRSRAMPGLEPLLVAAGGCSCHRRSRCHEPVCNLAAAVRHSI